MEASIQPHNQKPASVWSSGGARYDEISHGIADMIEHCVLRLAPQPGERIVDFGCGSGELTLELKMAVGSDGRVVGVDSSSSMVCNVNVSFLNAGFNANSTVFS